MRIQLTLVAALAAFQLQAQTYITNVTIADLEKQRLIAGQTVVIENDLTLADVKGAPAKLDKFKGKPLYFISGEAGAAPAINKRPCCAK